MHTPQTDRYFVDGNSKTQQKIVLTVLTTCKQLFWEILTWKLKRLLYITPPWRSYQTRFWEPSGDILAEALVGLNNAWQSVGMVIHGEVPYHKSAVCLQNTFLAVAS